MNRRQLITTAAGLLVVAPAMAWVLELGLGRRGGATMQKDERLTQFDVTRTDAEWKSLLTPLQYAVLRRHDTEFAGTSPLLGEHRHGIFRCAGCGRALFSSEAKYDSGSGWPSFSSALEGAVGTTLDRSMLMVRTEVHCGRCGGHLGHLFPDGPHPTGLRYCINGAALTFEPSR